LRKSAIRHQLVSETLEVSVNSGTIQGELSFRQRIRERQMHLFWGMLVVAAGTFMLVCGHLKSEFIIYRLMAARSKMMWGEHVHRFYQISGAIVIVFGVLMALGTF
jgi:uncharacterized membrane protein